MEEAVRLAKPYGVDIISGVESSPRSQGPGAGSANSSEQSKGIKTGTILHEKTLYNDAWWRFQPGRQDFAHEDRPGNRTPSGHR